MAAAHKIDAMTKNALDIVRVNDPNNAIVSHYGQALLAFSKCGKKCEHIGGFRWMWKRIFNKELFMKEGIWIPARVLAGNFAMIIVVFFVLLNGISITQKARDNFGKENSDDYFDVAIDAMFSRGFVKSDEIVKSVLNTTGVLPNLFQVIHNETKYNCASLALQKNSTNIGCSIIDEFYSCEPTKLDYICSVIPDKAMPELTSLRHVLVNATTRAVQQMMYDNFYPEERYMVVAPLAVGTCFATLAAISLTIVYIPSVISTTLQLRSGVIPTFRDPNFGKHRFGAELVTILLGSMFWGSMFASILVGGIFGLIVLFFLWQVTQSLAMQALAILAGLLVIIIFRVLIFLIIRTKLYQAFYRTKPARANIIQLALEASNYALSVGFVMVRGVKLLLTSALYIGRIDTPLLAPGVGNLWGNFELDNYPTIFIKDILAHEAHRHPYLELLGAMYMMKLRYQENFGRRSGSCWRLLFVYALMPWLSKYRILARKDGHRDDNDITHDPLEDTQSSLGFVSLRKNDFTLNHCFEQEVSLRRLLVDEPENEAIAMNLSQRSVLDMQNSALGEMDLAAIVEELPAVISAEEQAAILQEKNAILQRQVSDLKRELLLLKGRC
eukprot:CAMPEP_0183326472 /NCGR_PEP_ID=MMETSP0160_2-20130417/82261_1 /TAXON_ID=2839 ORGANISM="Odontella Sinensis, Strain Grunow 1884" /NCGR_SAMPLE_ID=MMETSP0160_2 /ASSEMBLY_ACC=CAM_ASM_000250 /LENGTH=611 /DNA_ID=CAMNT_0025494465 /DNA_START=70 /DNA_END=1905 /DNA_ORIENTATION=-